MLFNEQQISAIEKEDGNTVVIATGAAEKLPLSSIGLKG